MDLIVKDNKDLDERYIARINCAAAKLVAAEARLKSMEAEFTASRTASTLAADKLAATEERLRKIDSDLSVFRDASGLVAAFERTSTRPCPNGWRLFEPAGGRFIVGAGDNTNKDMNGVDLTDHTVGAVSGEERHKLNADELAPHKHGGTTGIASDVRNLRVVHQAGDLMLPNHVTGFAGGAHHDVSEHIPAQEHKHLIETDTGDGLIGTPHNTMPPFVALYYCFKE